MKNVDGLICNENGEPYGLVYNKEVNFTQTLSVSNDQYAITPDELKKQLPINIVCIATRSLTEMIREYTIVKITLRGSDKNNLLHYDFHAKDSSGNKRVFTGPTMLMTGDQMRNLNLNAVISKYNKIKTERDKLKIENDFAVRLCSGKPGSSR